MTGLKDAKQKSLQYSPKGNCYCVFELTQNVLLGWSLLSDCSNRIACSKIPFSYKTGKKNYIQ